MADALRSDDSGEVLHYVLYSADADRKLDPVSLKMLWSIHSNIVFVNASADPKSLPTGWSGLKEHCESILADSRFLAEVFAYAATVCADGLGGEVVQFLRSADPPSGAPVAPARAALLQLAATHRAAVLLAATKLRSEFPDSTVIAERAKTFQPINFPVWTTVKDHAGARVINEVWFPKEFAEPLMKSLAEAQARAMMQH